MNRSAFTMLELVFVIVVIGILTALTLPRLERDIKQEAADNILSSIRYTQHLALTDNKHRHDRTDWQKALWQIRFSESSNNWSYTVATDMNLDGNLVQSESTIDPSNGQLMQNVPLTNNYGIDTITFNNCTGQSGSTATHIAFDNFGRPHRGVTGATNTYTTYINNSSCQITFGSPSFDTDIVIVINRETGYAYIIDQVDS